MFHLSEQKSTKHFCMVAELADDLDPDALGAGRPLGPGDTGFGC